MDAPERTSAVRCVAGRRASHRLAFGALVVGCVGGACGAVPDDGLPIDSRPPTVPVSAATTTPGTNVETTSATTNVSGSVAAPLTQPVAVFDPVPTDATSSSDPLTWLGAISSDTIDFNIARVAAARDVAPDSVETRIDDIVVRGLLSSLAAEDLRGNPLGFGWKDVDLIVRVDDRENGVAFRVIVGYGSEALNASLHDAGVGVVDQPALYEVERSVLELGASTLALDPANEVLLLPSGTDAERVGDVLTRTADQPSLASNPIVIALLQAAGDAHAIASSSWPAATERYPQLLGVTETYEVLPNGNLDHCVLLPYSTVADADKAAAMLTAEIAARGDLTHLADAEIGTQSVVMTLCQHDRPDPDLFAEIFVKGLEFPPFR